MTRSQETLVQSSSRTAFVISPEGKVKGINDIAGSFTVGGSIVMVNRLNALARTITCNGTTVTITEGLDDDIGSSIWLSSFAMCAWLSKEGKVAIKNKTVVELGSGIGLAGIFAEKCAGPTHVCLTDGSQVLVHLCKHNIESNKCKNVHAEVFRWGEDVRPKRDQFDVLLASDCLYRLNNQPFLSAVLQNLKPGGTMYLINPTEAHRGSSGLDELIYALYEHGEVELKDLPITFTSTDGSYSTELMSVKFTRKI